MTAIAAASTARGADDGIVIPVPHLALCTQQVLVMQRLDGNAAELGAGHRPANSSPGRCSTRCCGQWSSTASSTPTRIRATCYCSATAGWACWTSAPSGALTPGYAARCSGC